MSFITGLCFVKEQHSARYNHTKYLLLLRAEIGHLLNSK